MDLGLQQKSALVTGASKGLGFAAAKALAAEGVTVHMASRSRERIEAAAQEIQKTGGTARPHVADLSRADSIDTLLDAAGPVDILVSNTGGPPAGSLDDFDEAEWRRQYEALFISALRLSSLLAPGMRKAGWGRILYITSVSILTPLPGLGISNALRSGIAGLAKTQAIEWGGDRVTVNCVAPGPFATDRLKELNREKAEKAGISLDEMLRRKGSGNPTGRIGDPGELGSLVAYLSSKQAGYLNGLVLPVDGGMHLL